MCYRNVWEAYRAQNYCRCFYTPVLYNPQTTTSSPNSPTPHLRLISQHSTLSIFLITCHVNQILICIPQGPTYKLDTTRMTPLVLHCSIGNKRTSCKYRNSVRGEIVTLRFDIPIVGIAKTDRGILGTVDISTLKRTYMTCSADLDESVDSWFDWGRDGDTRLEMAAKSWLLVVVSFRQFGRKTRLYHSIDQSVYRVITYCMSLAELDMNIFILVTWREIRTVVWIYLE